jgi:hypothetical protein
MSHEVWCSGDENCCSLQPTHESAPCCVECLGTSCSSPSPVPECYFTLTDWSLCDVTCGEGSIGRHLHCVNADGEEAGDCCDPLSDDESETLPCDTGVECPPSEPSEPASSSTPPKPPKCQPRHEHGGNGHGHSHGHGNGQGHGHGNSLTNNHDDHGIPETVVAGVGGNDDNGSGVERHESIAGRLGKLFKSRRVRLRGE